MGLFPFRLLQWINKKKMYIYSISIENQLRCHGNSNFFSHVNNLAGGGVYYLREQ